MKKLVLAFFTLTLLSAGIPGPMAYATDCHKETLIDQIGDRFALLGKEGLEKNSLLAKRKADRWTACAQEQAYKTNKERKKRLGL